MLDRLEAGTFSALKSIHKYLFDEIYDFAGELRTVNLSKGSFRFAPLMYLEVSLANIDKMPQSTFDEIDSREMYRKGIDHSYYYEGYTIFKTEEL